MLSMPNYSSAKIVKKGQFFPKDYQNTHKKEMKKRPSTEIIIQGFNGSFLIRSKNRQTFFKKFSTEK